MKLKDYVNLHNNWSAHLEEDADTGHKGLPEKKKKVDEAGRYHRKPYEGDDPRAKAFEQASKILDDLMYDSIEGDVAAYADDAMRSLNKAIEELEYQRNTVGNDPEADAARGMSEAKPSINEAEFVGHHAEIDGKMYVDSNFLNSVRKIRDTFPSSLESMGFGEFYLQTPKGRIDFDRSRGKQFEGMVGRSHQLYSSPPELADELINAMEQAGASETPQPSEEPPPGAEAIKEGGMGDLHLEIQGAIEEIMQQYGVRLSDIEGILGDMIADQQSGMMEGEGMNLTKEEFLKIVHEELQGEINKQSEEEAFYSSDDLRKMVREEVGGIIGDYKKSLEEGDEGNFITFSDGYKFKEVSKPYAASNWDKVDIYGLDLSSESESLIQSPDDLNQPWDAFGVETGGAIAEADEGGPGVHDIFNMPEPQAPESTGNPKEDAIREIVASQSMGRVEGVKLDLYSASAIVQVLDALSPQNKEKYMQLPVDKMAQMAFKMMG